MCTPAGFREFISPACIELFYEILRRAMAGHRVPMFDRGKVVEVNDSVSFFFSPNYLSFLIHKSWGKM